MNAPHPPFCFHCGTPVPPGTAWQAQVFGLAQPMCCPGCAAVAQSIVEAGQENFYRNRQGYSAKAPEQPVPHETLRLFDLRSNGGTVRFAVDGARCAACIWLIESTVRALPGVGQAELNIGSGVLEVQMDPAVCKPSTVMAALQDIGYAASPADATPYSARLQSEKRGLSRRLFIAGLSMMQVMMYAVPAYLATDGTMDRDMASLMRWAGLLLTLPAVLYSAQPMLLGAWRNLRNRVLGMDVPIALGIVAAFGASVSATIAGDGQVYFDSVTMFIFLLLASRTLELHARLRAARALDAMLRAAPASARRLPDWPASRREELVSTAQLQPQDVVLLSPGDVLGADGVLLEGETSIDMSVLSGESRPQQRQAGEALPAGACNLTCPVVVRVVREAQASTLALIVEAARRTRLDKPSLATWADKVATRFVAILLVLALLAWLFWLRIDAAQAWPVLISVLVVSCPCALSLAAPTVLAAANGRLLGAGILAVRPHVLETLHRSTHVVFDKTGTLSEGQASLHAIETVRGVKHEAMLALAARVCAGSKHPLSLALQRAAQRLPSATGKPSEVASRTVAGQGVEGVAGGLTYRAGSAEFVAGLCGGAMPFVADSTCSEVYLGCETGWLARFALCDTLRPEAAALVAWFKAHGKQVMLLSGDRQPYVARVAQQLGIDHARGACLPEGKVEFVRALQRAGAIVAMVGDGINDAAVLGAADVSFAMGEGSALAQVSADCVLLAGKLDSLRQADLLAGKAAQLMRQNLLWAALYNLVAIPAAAFGLIDPWMSAIGMSASSMLVVLNAMRIYRLPGKARHGRNSPAVPAFTGALEGQ